MVSCTVRFQCGSTDDGRYIWRHDSVLRKVEKIINQIIDSEGEIYCDASGRCWTIAPDIVATSDRPDLQSEKIPARPMLFYSTNYWQQF